MSVAQDFKTPLHRARNLGSAKTGVHHWLMVKITAIALIPLTLWFAYSIITNVVAAGGDFNTSLEWIKKPYHSFPLCLLLWINFYHAKLGGEEIILDYVHGKCLMPALILYKFFCYGLAAFSIYTVLFITFRM